MKLNDSISSKLPDNIRRTDSKLSEATRRLNSGYRINSAADDAAGLAVSEKLRAIDRGLRQGIRNIRDGINYLDTVDGAAQELSNMMQRMRELAIQSINGTYSKFDRRAMDLEYENLVYEIQQVTGNSDFNGVPLFQEHYPDYSYQEGNVVHDQPVVIDSTNDTLYVDHTSSGGSHTYSVTLPHGTYDAREIADLIDDDLYEKGCDLMIGMNEKRELTMQCENGKVTKLYGPASTLFYKGNLGKNTGFLLGVTDFDESQPRLHIYEGYNDTLSFRLGTGSDTLYTLKLTPTAHTDGTTPEYNMTNAYTRESLCEEINNQLQSLDLPADIKAIKYDSEDGKKVIGLESSAAITSLSGNFLKIDPFISPIYDIYKELDLDNKKAELIGKKVIESSTRIERGRNDFFTFKLGYYDNETAVTEEIRVDLLDENTDEATLTRGEIFNKIESALASKPFNVINDAGKVHIESQQFGSACSVTLSKENGKFASEHVFYDIFDAGQQAQVVPNPKNTSFTMASFTGGNDLRKQLNTNGKVVIFPDADELKFTVKISNTLDPERLGGSATTTYKLSYDLNAFAAAKEMSISEIIDYLNNNIDSSYTATGAAPLEDLSKRIRFVESSGRIAIVPNTDVIDSKYYVESMTADSSASGYRNLISGYQYSNANLSSTGTVTEEYPSSSANGAGYSTSSGYQTPVGGGFVYSNGANSSQAMQEKKLTSYSPASVERVEGYYRTTPIAGSTAFTEDSRTASLTLKGVLSQFDFKVSGSSAPPASIRTIDFSFTLSDSSGSVHNYSITPLPPGSTRDDLKQALEQKLNGAATVEFVGNDIVLTAITEKCDNNAVQFGANPSGNLVEKVTGGTTLPSWVNDPDPKYQVNLEKGVYYLPPSLTLGSAGTHFRDETNSPAPLSLGPNSKFAIDLGGTTLSADLSNRTFATLEDLASALDTAFSANKISVEAQNGGLVFVNTNKTGPDAGKRINISPESNVRLNQARTYQSNRRPAGAVEQDGYYKVPGTLTTNAVNTHIPLTVTGPDNNTVELKFTVNNSPQTAVIDLPNGTYTLDSLIGALTEADGKTLKNSGGNILVSRSGNELKFTTKEAGDGYSVTSLGGDANLHRFRNRQPAGSVQSGSGTNSKFYSPASITDPANIRFPVYITEGVNDTIGIKVNGNVYTNKIPQGKYTSLDSLLPYLKNAKNGTTLLTDVTNITQSGGIKITTKLNGTGASISTSGAGNTSPFFSSVSGPSSASASSRRFTACVIKGSKPLNGSFEITEANNKMSFTLRYYGVPQTIDIEVPPGTYTAQTLAEAIQSNPYGTDIDSAAQNLLRAGTFTSGGNTYIKIEAARIIENFGIDGFIDGDKNISGDYGLFDLAFRPVAYSGVDRHKTISGGSDNYWTAYIFGRNPIDQKGSDPNIPEGKDIMIYSGMNSHFSFKYEFKAVKNNENISAVRTIEVNLDGGAYTAKELAEEVQKQVREALSKDSLGIPAEYFYAGIGFEEMGISPPTYASDGVDLYESDKVKLMLAFKIPDDGSYDFVHTIIDSVKGNAAYSIFYSATQTPTASTAMGKPDLSEGIVIYPGRNDVLSFKFNGSPVTVKIPAGSYTTDSLSDTFNRIFKSRGSDLRVMNHEGHLMFYSSEPGPMRIDEFEGSAANDLYYGAVIETDVDHQLGIHTGRRTDSYIWFNMAEISAALMRINTTGVTDQLRAVKALNRLDNAINYLSLWRSTYGAYRNRSEFAEQRNVIMTENLTAAESGIRDADMAEELAAAEKQKLLRQVQSYMLANSKENAGALLNTLN